MKVTVCGCGNAVHVLTSYIGALPDAEVAIWSLYGDEAERLEKASAGNGITAITDDGREVTGKPVKISKNPQDVVPGSDMILMALPAFAHEMYLKAMKPWIDRDGVMIGAMPAQSGFDLSVRDIFGEELTERCIIFGTVTLPWACRVKEFGKTVEVLGTKLDMEVVVSPSGAISRVEETLSKCLGPYPVLESAGSFLCCTLMNVNAVWHPTILYGAFRNWDGHSTFKTKPLFYQAADAFTGQKMCAISDEIMHIKAALLEKFPYLNLKGISHVKDWFGQTYGDAIKDKSSMHRMLQSNTAYRGLVHPMREVTSADGTVEYLPNFKHRYTTEDLPCGLVVTRGIAELLKIPTPNIDEVLIWHQTQAQKEYLVNGKISGKDLDETRTPQRYGFHDLDAFMLANYNE